jgi:hypothetical protein
MILKYNYLWVKKKMQNIYKKLHSKKSSNLLIKKVHPQIEKLLAEYAKVLFNKKINLKLFNATILFVINASIVILSIKLDFLKKYIVLSKVV